ncbi:MAG TPA: hypothetical protein VK540_29075 [Polyangiaceae bacterium]|jgi:hypothetical protein|nr:hypothetical protein [Polyangiaceae bacterium]
MDTRIDPGGSRIDVIATESASRVTPPSGVPFREMVTRGAGAILRGAEAAISSLPGAPIVAAAVRPSAGRASTPLGTSGAVGLGVPRVPMTGGSAENPALGGPTVGAGPGGEGSSVEGALAQSQEFNLYYLQLQEQLSAENRAFSAVSNVLKTRHDTVKNAIGNIR